MKTKEQIIERLKEIVSALDDDMYANDYKDFLCFQIMKSVVKERKQYKKERKVLLWCLNISLEEFYEKYY